MPENKKARRTIKLRPIGAKKASSNDATPPPNATGGPEANTVKLSPVKPTNAASTVEDTSTAPVSSPTVKLSANTPPPMPAPPAEPTVKLSPGGAPPSAPTVKLSPAGAAPPSAPTVKLAANTTQTPAPGSGDDDRTQPLKRTPQAPATRPGSLIPGVEEKFDGKGEEATPSAQTKIAPSIPVPAQSAVPAPVKSATPPPPAAPGQVEEDTEEQETISMSREELEEDSTQKMGRPPVDDSTSPIQTLATKQTIKLRPSTAKHPAVSPTATPEPSQTSAKPAAASTIKLKPKPEAGSDDQEQTAAIAKQTIKLVPNKGKAAATAPKPSDPTVKLTETKAKAEPKPSDPTVKLTPKADAGAQPPAPGAKTVVLPSADASSSEAPAAPGMPKTKLSIKKQEPNQQAEMQEGQLAPGGETHEAEAASSDEPSIIFTLVAVFALIILGFVFVVMAAQYSNHWMGQNINIPVLSDSVK